MLNSYARSGVAHSHLAEKIGRTFPNAYLDGELWYFTSNFIIFINDMKRFGRGAFEQAQWALLNQHRDLPISWDNARFLAFDLADPKHFSDTYEDRYTILLHRVMIEDPCIVS